MKKPLFTILLGLLSSSLWAGSYVLTSSNVTDTSLGLTYSDTLDSSGGCFKANTDNTLQVSGFTLKRNLTWKSVTMTASGGAVTITITDSTGTTVAGPVSTSGSTTLSLSDKEAGKNGTNLIIKLQHNANCVSSLVVSYEEQGILVYPSPFVISEGNATIAFDVLNDASVTLEIFDSRGRRVRTIYKNEIVSSRLSPKVGDSWNGKNDQGNTVASGIYTVFVSVKYLNQSNGQAGDYTSTFRLVVLH